MGKTSQRKGADGERELAAVLREYGYEIERGGSLSYGEAPDLSGLPGVHIEVKRVERLNVAEAMQQAERDAERFQDGAPVVFHRRNRQPWLVTMRLDSFMDLYASAQKPKISARIRSPIHRGNNGERRTGGNLNGKLRRILENA